MNKKIMIIALLLAVSACKPKNVESVSACVDNKTGPYAAVSIKDDNGFSGAHLCQFKEGVTCEQLQKAKRINVVEKGLIKDNCEVGISLF
ncbi:MAG: hypothetical protein IPP74_03495 [Alphaproteobacteria bacterium]|nr:hypothetical protein [Alphaproteobacteria bacterium]